MSPQLHNPMPSLLELNDDVFTSLLSALHSAPLLALALTCRSMRDYIIPKWLYSHIDLLTSTKAQVFSFLRCITVEDPAVREAVEYLDIGVLGDAETALLKNLDQILQLLRNLRSFYIILPFELTPRSGGILRNLCSHVHLEGLELHQCTSEMIGSLQPLRPLRNIIIHPSECVTVGRGTALANIPINSQDTLQELKLSGVLWDADSFLLPNHILHQDLNGAPPTWPRVQTLELSSIFVTGCLNLTSSFPSTRFAQISLREGEWLIPCNRPFLAGLKSLRILRSDFPTVLDGCTGLRHLATHYGSAASQILTPSVLADSLPRGLHSLGVHLGKTRRSISWRI